MILSNEIPILPDSSGAIASRFMSIQLRQSFLDKEDYDLDRKLREEAPGIMKLWVEGLKSLHSKRRFVEPENSRMIVHTLASHGNPLLDFVEENCKFHNECIPRVWRVFLGA